MKRLLLLIPLTLVAACSAPHDNPLDPLSSNYHRPSSPLVPILNPSVRSVHISRVFPTTDSYAVMTDMISSGEPPMDTAWVSYRGGAGVALHDTSNGHWTTQLSASYFGNTHLGSVVGQPFTFFARDADGNEFDAGPAYLFRVIEEVPQTVSPAGQDTVGPRPSLVWQDFDQTFPFTYCARIINQTDGVGTTAWMSSLLSSDSLSAHVGDSLPDGNYYWTLTVADSFNNTSRSKEAGFVVNLAASLLRKTAPSVLDLP